MKRKQYYVYIMANQKPVLYIGVTNNLQRRVYEHKIEAQPGFTTEYDVKKLIYFEETDSIEAAIAREKRLKRWHRQWKLNLVCEQNPHFEDLALSLNADPETSSG